jgi:hypothetical protein
MQTPKSLNPICIAPGSLVERVRHGDSAGAEELRRLLSCGVRFLVARKLPNPQVDACVREVFDRVIRGIQCGCLGNPVRLEQFVHMHLTTHIREIQHKEMPEQHAPNATSLSCGTDEHWQIMRDLLLGLSPIERESLVRFYAQGHDEQRLCRDLCMPTAEFRSLRARVKSRFHELCQ